MPIANARYDDSSLEGSFHSFILEYTQILVFKDFSFSNINGYD